MFFLLFYFHRETNRWHSGIHKRRKKEREKKKKKKAKQKQKQQKQLCARFKGVVLGIKTKR